MRIKHYLYNAFLIESGEKKIAIDPGALFFYFFRFTTLIPKSEWDGITHIFVTHGDPDHYWHFDRVASASGAAVICNETMVRNIGGEMLMLGPRDKGLSFTTRVKHLHPVSVGESMDLDGMSVTGIKTTHGELALKIGPFRKTVTPGPEERVGWGAIGYQIELDGKSIVNLGDTLFHDKEWEMIRNPDVLMIPIGGRTVHNTMDEKQALRAVQAMKPGLVIPCHYNCPAFFTKKYNPADDLKFREDVEKSGVRCAILRAGDSIEV